MHTWHKACYSCRLEVVFTLMGFEQAAMKNQTQRVQAEAIGEQDELDATVRPAQCFPLNEVSGARVFLVLPPGEIHGHSFST